MSAPELVPGQIVAGRFTIRRQRTRTAITATYEAITAPSRSVELKVFDLSVRQGADIEALLHTAMRATNQLPSSMVLPIIDVGIDHETGAPFVATELSASPSLAELVQLCPLALDEVIAFARNLGAALDAAHAQGLSHLGLCADNVFVGPSPRFEVRLADFGVASLSRHAASDPRWAAPEVLAVPTPACDVFSAGILVLFAATGAPLGDRSEPSLRAPATALARETGNACDARFDAPIARALALDPAQRYRTVPELAEAVAQAFGKLSPDPAMSSRPRLIAAPVVAPPPGSEPRLVVAPQQHEMPFAPPPPAAEMAFTPPPPEMAYAPPPPPAMFVTSPEPMDAMAAIAAPAPEPLRRGRAPLVIGAALLGGLVVFGAVGWALSRRADARAGAAAASATASGSGSPAAALASATGATGATTPAGATTPTGATAATGAQQPADPMPTARLNVSCTPECDSISVDGGVVATFPTNVRPGEHVVVARRGTHAPQTKRVLTTAGNQETVEFVFFAERPRTPPKKNCGKFLQRCD